METKGKQAAAQFKSRFPQKRGASYVFSTAFCFTLFITEKSGKFLSQTWLSFKNDCT